MFTRHARYGTHGVQPRATHARLDILVRSMHLLLACLLSSSSALQIAITGTNSGIGQSAAKLLIEQGHTVYHACRTAEGAAQAVIRAGGGVPMVCDLSDLASIRSFSEQLSELAPSLDVLCLNAGVSPSRKALVPARTKDGYEATIGINHIGHFCLAQLLQPVLARNRGRLVVTASGVHDPESAGGTVQVYRSIMATACHCLPLSATDLGVICVSGRSCDGGDARRSLRPRCHCPRWSLYDRWRKDIRPRQGLPRQQAVQRPVRARGAASVG